MTQQWVTRTTVDDKPPTCFGTQLWDPRHTDCVGGPNPAYKDPETGQHVQRPCKYYNACGARYQAERQKQLIPTTALTRQVPAPMQQVARPYGSGGPTQPIVPQQPQQSFPAQVMQQLLAHQQQQVKNGQLPVGYQQMMPVNYSVPAYLTVREEQMENEGVFSVLGRELFRSVGKSFGHTLAAFFDTTPLRRGPRQP